MKILKFGGSSVANQDNIARVKQIAESNEEQVVVVVSALKGVTDHLIQISQDACARKDAYLGELQIIRERHISLCEALVDDIKKEKTLQLIHELFTDLTDILHGVYLLKELTAKTKDYILSFGERFSAILIANIIDKAVFIDSREIIFTDNRFGNARVDFDKTNKQIAGTLKTIQHPIVLPGFIASSHDDETTTLGRGGSDFTAAIIANAIDASVLEIWTDVDGFMTADPKKVEKAYPIKHLSYAEAMELSHFGAKVIYTPTIQPVYNKNIPVVIKNTFNPEAPGTTISDSPEEPSVSPLKGISSIDGIDLITIQGAGMVGITGISMRLFSCLAKQNVNIILITQASSEYSISFAIAPADTETARQAIEEEFIHEIKLRKNIAVNLERNLSVIAIVGEGMRKTPGISANLFRSLGQNGINVIATAQGSSELNISVVVSHESLKKALNAIHEGFFLSLYKELHLFIAGIGTVGGILIRQLKDQLQNLEEENKLRININGITNSRKMLFDAEGIDLDAYNEKLEKSGEKAGIQDFVFRIKQMNLRNSVFVDCTANEEVAGTYHDLFDSYVSVVTANKIACSSDYKMYRQLKENARKKNVKFSFETNVGAGLPIINTINDLVRSGDHILKLEAVLSGTLNFIFNVLSAEVSLSKAIKMAKEKGYSEPDPRVDLSGIDVVRKLLILARESGYQLEKEDVEVETFIPDEAFEGSLDDFWSHVESLDEEFEQKRQKLQAENKKWRFVALLDGGKANVSLQTVDISHPAFALEGSNNIVSITTERYKELPMVIKGYGAGAGVTAAGVFADIIRIANV